jgi:transcriptional regulator with XRE-family HTH domain
MEKSFCDVFRELRLEKDNMSQDAIAKELDVSQSLINNWETNKSTPSPEMLEYIGDYFGVSVDYLIGRTNDRRFIKKDTENTKLDILYNKTKDILNDDERAMIEFTMQRAIDRYEEEKNK